VQAEPPQAADEVFGPEHGRGLENETRSKATEPSFPRPPREPKIRAPPFLGGFDGKRVRMDTDFQEKVAECVRALNATKDPRARKALLQLRKM
jgi:hypothetical protein